MGNQQPNPPISPASAPGRKGEQDSHAAGSGSSTGDPGNVWGQPGDKAVPIGKHDSTEPAGVGGGIPID